MKRFLLFLLSAVVLTSCDDGSAKLYFFENATSGTLEVTQYFAPEAISYTVKPGDRALFQPYEYDQERFDGFQQERDPAR